ncbi:MAG: hypothetical protein DIU70_001000 [Bacillota bacterium]|nr:MAG: hypothetical protein DIU70_11005 [Bacillota bacterium]
MGGLRPVDFQGAMGRSPETTHPAHREAGPQAAQHVFQAEFRQAVERRQQAVSEVPPGERTRVQGEGGRRRRPGSQGGLGGEARQGAAAGGSQPAEPGPPAPGEPGKGTRLDIRI